MFLVGAGLCTWFMIWQGVLVGGLGITVFGIFFGYRGLSMLLTSDKASEWKLYLLPIAPLMIGLGVSGVALIMSKSKRGSGVG